MGDGLEEKERYETLYMKEQMELAEPDEQWLLIQIRRAATA